MLKALKTTMSIDDLADILEIQEVHASWIEAEHLNDEAADAVRRRQEFEARRR